MMQFTTRFYFNNVLAKTYFAISKKCVVHKSVFLYHAPVEKRCSSMQQMSYLKICGCIRWFTDKTNIAKKFSAQLILSAHPEP